MKSILLFIFFSAFFMIPSVFAFGEVAGPVVFTVPIGGNNVSSWGISNDQAINVKLSAEGDAMKYLSFPDSITLQPNNQIYWVNLTAKIPSDYNVTQGTNITGTLSAVAAGQPGQVQINLRLKKSMYILVQPATVQESVQQFSEPFQIATGLFALGPLIYLPAAGAIVILIGIFYFARKRKQEVKI